MDKDEIVNFAREYFAKENGNRLPPSYHWFCGEIEEGDDALYGHIMKSYHANFKHHLYQVDGKVRRELLENTLEIMFYS